MANVSDLVGFALAVTLRYKKETERLTLLLVHSIEDPFKIQVLTGKYFSRKKKSF